MKYLIYINYISLRPKWKYSNFEIIKHYSNFHNIFIVKYIINQIQIKFRNIERQINLFDAQISSPAFSFFL